jgi:type II secretory ATPase GspE/PulE/Tfp pilus assembly ATPase PilB-like protein
LVRTICKNCKEKHGTITELGYTPENGENFEVYQGTGCDLCGSSGFSGRIGLYELLVIDDRLNRGISQGVDLVDLRKIAEASGFKPMFADGLAKVKQGITTFAEVVRVCRGTEESELI